MCIRDRVSTQSTWVNNKSHSVQEEDEEEKEDTQSLSAIRGAKNATGPRDDDEESEMEIPARKKPQKKLNNFFDCSMEIESRKETDDITIIRRTKNDKLEPEEKGGSQDMIKLEHIDEVTGL
eukprot:TRINITY_DN19981_c0_g1_i1.p2 TRINITY_DN19981_c0_g1~~TRINITY_DN19981_c0_g1_i1.p2  ORF type:complete len:122 (+),score=42.19 TRINITY_DN19981_c0_g1_i1:66-431(+)